MNQREGLLWGVLMTGVLLVTVAGCDPVEQGMSQSDSSQSGGSEGGGSEGGGSERGGSGNPKLPGNFFRSIPLPEGAEVVDVRSDEFGDPIVEFSVPSPAQPLHAWYTIESSKRGWGQISSVEKKNGGGRGMFSHSSEDRFFHVEIEPTGDETATIVITYRGAGV